MPSVLLYHGGVRRLRVNDRILPPNSTGAISNASYGAGVCRRDRVYLTTDLTTAQMWACMYPPRSKGWVYEVEPIGVLEADPDWLGEPGGSVQAPAARVLRVVERDIRTFHGLTALQLALRLQMSGGDLRIQPIERTA